MVGCHWGTGGGETRRNGNGEAAMDVHRVPRTQWSDTNVNVGRVSDNIGHTRSVRASGVTVCQENDTDGLEGRGEERRG